MKSIIIFIKMTKIKTQKELFKFLNKNKTRYVVLRGYDENSKKEGKDLDILILKEDYKKIKIPKVDRILHFYFDKEKHFGIIFVAKKALFRRKFDKEKGFFILSKKDYSRMKFFRKILKMGRKIKKFFNMY